MRLAPLLAIGLAASAARADEGGRPAALVAEAAIGVAPASPRAEPVGGGPSTAAATDPRFVRVEGDHFVVDGARFSFAGANANVMQGEHERARYRETLAALRADGLTVARVWAFAEGPADAGDWWRRDHLFRAGPDGYVEAAYRHLDAVVAEAGRLGLRLIVTLGNNWGDYGGIPMYLRWAGLPPGQDAVDPAREAFYTDARVRAFYREGLARLLGRVNSVTGVRYVDDPAIFSWELLNESVVASPAGRAARRAWIAEMAGLIRAQDRHHLVAPGVVAYTTRDERRDWIAVHRMKEVDYCDSHLYAEQEPTLRGRRALERAIDDRAQLARFVVGKPLVIGEFGFRTDRGPGTRGWLGARAEAWFERLLARAHLDGVAGALTWIYQPWGGKPRDFGIYTDRGDTDGVRAVMRAQAARFVAGPGADENPRLGPAVGARLLYDPAVTVRQAVTPARRVLLDGEDRIVEIRPERFAEARFDRAGTAAGEPGGAGTGALPHAYGAGAGTLTYHFLAPALAGGAAPSSIRVAARVSSERPGYHPTGSPEEPLLPSRAEVLLDGDHAGWISAPPDDGVGAWRALTVRGPALLARLASPGVHTLAFRVPDEGAAGAEPQGLCLYGAPARGTPAPTDDAGPIRVRYRR